MYLACEGLQVDTRLVAVRCSTSGTARQRDARLTGIGQRSERPDLGFAAASGD